MAQITSAALEAFLEQTRTGDPAGDGAAMIDQLAVLERLTAATQALTARVSAQFHAWQVAEHAAAEVPAARRGRGAADQVGLARRISAASASTDLVFARALRDDLPMTARLFASGTISQDVARAVHSQTSHLERLQRQQIDLDLHSRLPGCSWVQARSLANDAACRADPAAMRDRIANAVKDRRVWARPAPDTMVKLTALLPVVQGVSSYATLRRDAQSLIAGGQAAGRTLQQVMADLLTERLTGVTNAEDVPVEVNLIMTPATVFGQPQPDPSNDAGGPTTSGVGSPTTDAGNRDTAHCEGQGDNTGCGDDGLGATGATGGEQTACAPAFVMPPPVPGVDPDPDASCWVDGYGPIPAVLARAVIAGAPDLLGHAPADLDSATRWLRRVFVDPVTGQPVAVDGRRRRFDGVLRTLIQVRDRVCRVPYCDAPISDIDHIHRHTDGGLTSVDNGVGVCRRFNQIKETPGWSTTVIHNQPDTSPPGTRQPGTRQPGTRQPGTGSPGTRPPGHAPGVTAPHGHTMAITTPTGHTYYSTAPPVHGTSAAAIPDAIADLINAHPIDRAHDDRADDIRCFEVHVPDRAEPSRGEIYLARQLLIFESAA